MGLCVAIFGSIEMSELEQALSSLGITSEAIHIRFVGREIDGTLIEP
jgi:hypothetical protein